MVPCHGYAPVSTSSIIYTMIDRFAHGIYHIADVLCAGMEPGIEAKSTLRESYDIRAGRKGSDLPPALVCIIK